jgi:hypothetical protein
MTAIACPNLLPGPTVAGPGAVLIGSYHGDHSISAV